MGKVRCLLLSLVLLMISTNDARKCHDKYKFQENHSMCADPSPDFVNFVKAPGDETSIRDLHNAIRREVDEPAANMQMAVWDGELEEIAKGWASQCKDSSDSSMERRIPGKYHVGQNIALNVTTWANALSQWTSRKSSFTHGDMNNYLDKELMKYVQIIFAQSVRIGCSRADCKGGKKVFVCNYARAVTTQQQGAFPYEKKVGSQMTCTSNEVNKLCDCKGQICENGGTTNVQSCSCTCLSNSFFVGDYCSLNCTAKGPDMPDCDSQTCAGLTVPFTCPYKCKDCPYGGVGYSGSNSNHKGTFTFLVSLFTFTMMLN